MGKMNSKQASQIRNLGHTEETTFSALFGDKDNSEINHSGASQDNVITNPNYQLEISKKPGRFENYSVSLKSGKTWQFHLGKIEEISDTKKIVISKSDKGETIVTHTKTFVEQLLVLRTIDYWDNYLGQKSELLCYNDKLKSYTLFKIDSVTKFLSEK